MLSRLFVRRFKAEESPVAGYHKLQVHALACIKSHFMCLLIRSKPCRTARFLQIIDGAVLRGGQPYAVLSLPVVILDICPNGRLFFLVGIGQQLAALVRIYSILPFQRNDIGLHRVVKCKACFFYGNNGKFIHRRKDLCHFAAQNLNTPGRSRRIPRRSLCLHDRICARRQVRSDENAFIQTRRDFFP